MKIVEFSVPQAERFPVKSRLSFVPFLEYMKEKLATVSAVERKFYSEIIAKIEACPETPEPSTDVLKDNEELISLVKLSLTPFAADEDQQLWALSSPFPPALFYYTKAFEQTFLDAEGNLKDLTVEPFKNTERDLRFVYKIIFDRCYNLRIGVGGMFLQKWIEVENNSTKYLKVNLDNRFIKAEVEGELPDISAHMSDLQNSEFADIELLKSILPLDKFTLSGFTILTVEDATAEEALSIIKNAVLNMHTQESDLTLSKVEDGLKTLLGNRSLCIGIMPFLKVNDQVIMDEEIKSGHILINTMEVCPNHINYKDSAKFFEEKKEPLFIPVVDDNVIAQHPYLHTLIDKKVMSYVAIPIFNNGKPLGVLEIGAPQPGFLTTEIIHLLKQATPIIKELFFYLVERFKARMDKFIKKKFTSLQPAVEWKFNEVAWEHLKNKSAVETPVPDIVFDNVYPLYGAIDIRNSSVERNIAIRKDILNQIAETEDLLDLFSLKVKLPLLEKLLFKCNQFRELTAKQLSTEDEVRINDFFKTDIADFFEYILKVDTTYLPHIEEYDESTDELTGKFHLHQREYEAGLMKINNVINTYLDKEKEEVQQIYPHYFEKYRTDGVEYNIYIGQSIAPKRPFDVVYLKNLQLWQLTSMVEIARLTKNVLPDLDIPLQTTQLILAYRQPISISFRKDERRFDVEGSYNIRYEIMKKRIDKALIKDTKERFTKEDHISIVYSNNKQADEYLQYIEFLQNKGMLGPVIENVELEELQGVSGLNGLRVKVLYEQD